MTVRRLMEENLAPLKMALDSETMPPYERNWSFDTYCSVSDIFTQDLEDLPELAIDGSPTKAEGEKDPLKTKTTPNAHANRFATPKQVAFIRDQIQEEGNPGEALLQRVGG